MEEQQSLRSAFLSFFQLPSYDAEGMQRFFCALCREDRPWLVLSGQQDLGEKDREREGRAEKGEEAQGWEKNQHSSRASRLSIALIDNGHREAELNKDPEKNSGTWIAIWSLPYHPTISDQPKGQVANLGRRRVKNGIWKNWAFTQEGRWYTKQDTTTIGVPRNTPWEALKKKKKYILTIGNEFRCETWYIIKSQLGLWNTNFSSETVICTQVFVWIQLKTKRMECHLTARPPIHSFFRPVSPPQLHQPRSSHVFASIRSCVFIRACQCETH